MLERDKSRVLVVVNSDVPLSAQAADLYCRLRGIPAWNQWIHPMGISLQWGRQQKGFEWQYFVQQLAAECKSRQSLCVVFSAATPLYYSGGPGYGVAVSGIVNRLFMFNSMATDGTWLNQSALATHGGDIGFDPIGTWPFYTRSLAWHRMARHVGLPSGRLGVPVYASGRLADERMEDVERVIADAIANELSIAGHARKQHICGISTRTKGSSACRAAVLEAGIPMEFSKWFAPTTTNRPAVTPEDTENELPYSQVMSGTLLPRGFFSLVGGAITNPWAGAPIPETTVGIVSATLKKLTGTPYHSAPGSFDFYYEVETAAPHNFIPGRNTTIAGVSFPLVNNLAGQQTGNYAETFTSGELARGLAFSSSISATKYRGRTFQFNGGYLGEGQDEAAFSAVTLSGATATMHAPSTELSNPYYRSFIPERGAWVYENTSFSHMVGQDMLIRGACAYTGAIVEPMGAQLATDGIVELLMRGMTIAEAAFLCGAGVVHSTVGDPLYAPYKGSARPVVSVTGHVRGALLGDPSFKSPGNISAPWGVFADFAQSYGDDHPLDAPWP